MSKRNRVLAILMALLLMVFALGAYAGSKTPAEREAKKSAKAASKAAKTGGDSNVTVPGPGAALAYPANLRFFTVNHWYDEEGGILRELDILSGETIEETPITIDEEQVFGLSGIAEDPTTGDVYVIVKLEDPEDLGDALYNATMLATLDLTTGEAEEIATMDRVIADIAFDSDGTLYGVSGDGDETSSETLYTIDTADGDLTLVQTLGNGGDGEAITFDPISGRIFHFSGNNEVMESFLPGDDPDDIEISGDELEEPGAVAYIGNNQILNQSYDGALYVVDLDGHSALLSDTDHDPTGLLVSGSLINEVSDGQEAEFIISVDPVDNDGETYAFECTSGLPDGATCEFSPAEVTVGTDDPPVTTLTVHTDGSASLLPSTVRGTFAMWLMLPSFAVIGLVIGRKKAAVRNTMLMVLLVSAMLLMGACGGEDNRFGGGGGGNGDLSLITVTATSENDTQTFQVALEVN